MTYITEREAEQLFDDFIDEITPDVVILGMHYSPSRALKDMDPIGYNCELANFLDSENLTTDESEGTDTSILDDDDC